MQLVYSMWKTKEPDLPSPRCHACVQGHQTAAGLLRRTTWSNVRERALSGRFKVVTLLAHEGDGRPSQPRSPQTRRSYQPHSSQPRQRQSEERGSGAQTGRWSDEGGKRDRRASKSDFLSVHRAEEGRGDGSERRLTAERGPQPLTAGKPEECHGCESFPSHGDY